MLRIGSAPVSWHRDFFSRGQLGGIWGFELGDEWPVAFVGAAAQAGVPVFAYTVNDETTMRRLIEMGIRGIETDDPALLLRVAASLNAR